MGNEDTDTTAEAIGQTIATTFTDGVEFEDWQAEGPRRQAHPGRFSFLHLTAPNGQTYKVTVEEMD